MESLMGSFCLLVGGVGVFFISVDSMANILAVLPKDIRIPQHLIHDFLGGHPEVFLDLAEFIADRVPVAGLRRLHRQPSVPKYQSELAIFHVCVTHASSILWDDFRKWSNPLSHSYT